MARTKWRYEVYRREGGPYSILRFPRGMTVGYYGSLDLAERNCKALNEKARREKK